MIKVVSILQTKRHIGKIFDQKMNSKGECAVMLGKELTLISSCVRGNKVANPILYQSKASRDEVLSILRS